MLVPLHLLVDSLIDEAIHTLATSFYVGLDDVLFAFWNSYIDPIVCLVIVFIIGSNSCFTIFSFCHGVPLLPGSNIKYRHLLHYDFIIPRKSTINKYIIAQDLHLNIVYYAY